MSSKTGKLVLKKNKKLDKIYHPESGLVFKSTTEKLVVGRIADDEFISLDEVSLDLCEKYNFKYDESLVETEEVEESGTNSNEETTENQSEHDNSEEKVPDEKVQDIAQNTNQDTIPSDSKEQEKEDSSESVDHDLPSNANPSPSQVTRSDNESHGDQKSIKNSFIQDELVVEKAANLDQFDVTPMINRFSAELVQFMANRQTDYNKEHQRSLELEKKVQDLDTQNSQIKKELEDVKRKLRGVLAAMQSEL